MVGYCNCRVICLIVTVGKRLFDCIALLRLRCCLCVAALCCSLCCCCVAALCCCAVFLGCVRALCCCVALRFCVVLLRCVIICYSCVIAAVLCVALLRSLLCCCVVLCVVRCVSHTLCVVLLRLCVLELRCEKLETPSSYRRKLSFSHKPSKLKCLLKEIMLEECGLEILVLN